MTAVLRRAGIASVAAVAGAVHVGGAAATQQDPAMVFRAARDVVRVEFSVSRSQRPVTDLTTDEIRVLDNGVPQRILDFGYERALPIDVTVVLDVSTSVSGGMLNQLKRGVESLQSGLHDRDRLKLTTFSSRVSRRVPFGPADADALRDAFRDLGAAGNTSLYDAIALSLVAAADPARRQLVVVFSDGEDTTSIVQPPMLMEVARRTHAAVFVVVPARIRGMGDRMSFAAQMVYTKLTHETGGMVASVSGVGELPSTFRRMLDEFRQMYILHFTPTGVERRGFHTLDIEVTREGQYWIRARRGYTWSGIGPVPVP